MVSNVSGINSSAVTAKILPPKEDKLYQNAVIIDGKEKIAVIEEHKDGTVKIQVPNDNGEIETINTNKEGLMKFMQKHMPPQIIYSAKPKTTFGSSEKEQKTGYAGYRDSFFSNDPEVLKKRVKQAKYVGITFAATSVISALAVLKNGGVRIIPAVLSVFMGLGALSNYRYIKQTQEKINRLETNA